MQAFEFCYDSFPSSIFPLVSLRSGIVAKLCVTPLVTLVFCANVNFVDVIIKYSSLQLSLAQISGKKLDASLALHLTQ